MTWLDLKSTQFKVHDIYSSSLVFTCLCKRQNLPVESEKCRANCFTHKFKKKEAGNLSEQFKSVFDLVFFLFRGWYGKCWKERKNAGSFQCKRIEIRKNIWRVQCVGPFYSIECESTYSQCYVHAPTRRRNYTHPQSVAASHTSHILPWNNVFSSSFPSWGSFAFSDQWMM